jgi:hypothetical protein
MKMILYDGGVLIHHIADRRKEKGMTPTEIKPYSHIYWQQMK